MEVHTCTRSLMEGRRGKGRRGCVCVCGMKSHRKTTEAKQDEPSTNYETTETKRELIKMQRKEGSGKDGGGVQDVS